MPGRVLSSEKAETTKIIVLPSASSPLPGPSGILGASSPRSGGLFHKDAWELTEGTGQN